MGFNFGNFVRNAAHGLKRFGGTVNRTFNVVKSHARKAIPFIRRVSGQIRDGARGLSTLPLVGAALSQLGVVAGAVHTGTHLAERFFDNSERWQRGMGIDTSLRQ